VAETPSLPARPAITRSGGRNPFDVSAADGEHYAAVRPSYPAAAVDWALEGVSAGVDQGGVAGPRLDVVEVGAGTGLCTRALAAHPAVASVRAVEPAEHMRALLVRDVVAGSDGLVRALSGTAEATGLPSSSADVVVAAQVWHWVDVAAASREAARVLRPGGHLMAVWNQLDTQVPWVHRLTRIMHAGDVHAAAPEQRRFAAPFGAEDHERWTWSLTVTPRTLHALMASRSYWLRSGERTRARMAENLSWYLHEHLGHGRDAQIVLPHLTVAWRARVR